MRRREFCRNAAGSLAAASPLLRLGRGRRRLQPVGLQLYTVRELMKEDFEGTLAQVAETGYLEVEFAGYFGVSPEEVGRALLRNRLFAPSAHISLEALSGDWTLTLEQASAIGHRYLVVPSIPRALRQTIDDWGKLADLLNRAGREARSRGITLGYHNHDFEFAPIDGQVPYDFLLTRTDPELVVFEMDLFWIRKGGHDPLSYFEAWPGRFPMVHVKDMAEDGSMVDVGAGRIDWRAIVGRREQAGIRHWFVEHDEPRDPLASIRASYGYVSTLHP